MIEAVREVTHEHGTIEGLNSPLLKRERLVEIIKCDACKKFNIVFSDPDRPRWREEQCHYCFKGIDRKNKVGDSHNPELYPGWGFAIEGKTPKGFTFIQPYMLTTCPTCIEETFIPYSNGCLQYNRCPECAKARIAKFEPKPRSPTPTLDAISARAGTPVRSQVTQVQAQVPAPVQTPVTEGVEFLLKVPPHLVRPFKDYVFANDVTKLEAAVRALELMLK